MVQSNRVWKSVSDTDRRMVTSGDSTGDIPEWSRIAIDNGEDEDAGAGLQEC